MGDFPLAFVEPPCGSRGVGKHEETDDGDERGDGTFDNKQPGVVSRDNNLVGGRLTIAILQDRLDRPCLQRFQQR